MDNEIQYDFPTSGDAALEEWLRDTGRLEDGETLEQWYAGGTTYVDTRSWLEKVTHWLHRLEDKFYALFGGRSPRAIRFEQGLIALLSDVSVASRIADCMAYQDYPICKKWFQKPSDHKDEVRG